MSYITSFRYFGIPEIFSVVNGTWLESTAVEDRIGWNVLETSGETPRSGIDAIILTLQETRIALGEMVGTIADSDVVEQFHADTPAPDSPRWRGERLGLAPFPRTP